MTWVLRLLSLDGEVIEDEAGALPFSGGFLHTYDPEAHDGLGSATWTPDLDKAMHFPSFREAMECWRRQSKTRPLRPDGKPNRPLTAFTVSPEQVP